MVEQARRQVMQLDFWTGPITAQPLPGDLPPLGEAVELGQRLADLAELAGKLAQPDGKLEPSAGLRIRTVGASFTASPRTSSVC